MKIYYNEHPVRIDKFGIEFMCSNGWVVWVWPWMRHTNNNCSIYSLDFMGPFKTMDDFLEFYRQCSEELFKLSTKEILGGKYYL